MARSLRIEYEGAFYHVIQRGLERKKIFSSDKDKDKLFSYLNLSYLSYKAIFHAYVLMDNHYHLIIETPKANLSKIMHYLNTSYATYFNSKYKRVGPLYQGRFKAILVQRDEYLHYLSCYVHLNPLRAGIVKSPDEYQYSSYNFFTSKKEPPQWLCVGSMLSMFDKNTLKAKRLYRQFVLDNIGREKDVINDNIKKGFILGNDDFFRSVKDRLIDVEEDHEMPLLKQIKRPAELSLRQIKNIVGNHLNNDKRLGRAVSVYLSRKYTQKTLNEIAVFYGNIKYSGISQIWRRMENRRSEDKDLRKVLANIELEIIKMSNVKT